MPSGRPETFGLISKENYYLSKFLFTKQMNFSHQNVLNPNVPNSAFQKFYAGNL